MSIFDKDKLTPNISRETTDLIVKSVMKKFNERSLTGIKKYGTGLKDAPLDLKQTLIHLQEELMDATNYIEKIIDLLNTQEEDKK